MHLPTTQRAAHAQYLAEKRAVMDELARHKGDN